MLTKKLSCPSCGVGLKVADTLAEGARIKCPKCGVGFPVPKSNGQAVNPNADDEEPASPVVVRKRKPAPPPEPADYGMDDVEDEPEATPVVRKRRKPAPPEDEYEDEDDDNDDDYEERPVPRRRPKKRKKSGGNTALIVTLVIIGFLLLVGGGATAAILIFSKDKKSDQVVSANSPPPGAGRRGPPSRGGAGEGRLDRAPSMEGSKSSGAAPSEGGGNVANGQQLFQDNCTRCHRVGGSNGPGGRGRGPDLSTIGQQHDEDWFVEFIRDPNSKKPGSRGMPKFGGKLSDDELRAVAKYLTSLK
jgi:mono/diheme cytochrome c family protein